MREGAVGKPTKKEDERKKSDPICNRDRMKTGLYVNMRVLYVEGSI